jgi:hypothetical protein
VVLRRVLVIAATLAVVVPTISPASSAAHRPAPRVLGVGLMASTDASGLGGWLPSSGVPWTYAYRYLGGGAGTSKNWTAMAPEASYPILYASLAARHGYTPVFTYYQMLAGHDCRTCGEAQRDLANLNDPVVMRGYFNDFALLMKRLGTGTYDGVNGYGHDAVVHVEPDLSGYAERAVLSPGSNCFGHCTRQGNDPSNLRAAVQSTGLPSTLRYPNTFRGFNEALLRLRDTYAPNVRLAVHVSNWATGYDLNSSSDNRLQPAALGRLAGSFAAQSGAGYTDGSHSTYDLVFNDVSNKDAGYYQKVLHKNRFWDQANNVFPNFHRWEAYLKAVRSQTHRWTFVWQVPIGNQLLQSENNTAGHYQDNRVQYFFDHMTELRDSGIAAVLFGTTISAASNFADVAHDGTTNPRKVCSQDGWSTGRTVCSSRHASRSDDDGGYLRERAASYYRQPLALG